MKRTRVALLTAVIALPLGLGACSTQPVAPGSEPTTATSSAPTQPKQPAQPEQNETKASAGSYISYENYDGASAYPGNDVVLFFNASWCPTCQEANENLNREKIPAGLTVVSVDFDDNTDLRQTYGVTTQHTFVQVDTNEKQLAKFTGATSTEQIANQLVQ